MRRKTFIFVVLLAAFHTVFSESLPHMVKIKGGTFLMGNIENSHFDEFPPHRVRLSSFHISETEITNKQYEEFCPSHRLLRGKNNGISSEDDDAVVNVSYYDAVEYCKWLSNKTHKNFRLPTEAEWEYTCRAGTSAPYFFGDTLPLSVLKNQTTVRNFQYVSLKVKQTPPNAFGVYDMHGNVEEWCLDWFYPYSKSINTIKNPVCLNDSSCCKVTRGGSHSTPIRFLKSTYRMAMLPDDCHSQTGFRIVESPIRFETLDNNYNTAQNHFVKKSSFQWKTIDYPLFKEPVPYVITPIYTHNHQPAICYCQNGDILVSWYSTPSENGREMVELSSRLNHDTNSWTPSKLFFRVPGRNITGLSLMNDDGVIRHINGVEASGDWQNLIMIQRLSYDDGITWTHPFIIEAEHSKRHQVIAGPIKNSKGELIQLCDAGPAGDDGTSIHISKDNGKTWTDLWNGIKQEKFKNGAVGSTIAGIHASVIELKDGTLMALGRGNTIEGKMPMSISADGGRTWIYKPSEFSPISSGQRLVLMRLKEGPILLLSFTDEKNGMIIADKLCYGLFAAISFDEGKTWPVKKLISDGKIRKLNGGAWTNEFVMDEHHAEPRGYLAATESPDGIIHLVSSGIYYAFNLKWLLDKK